MWAVPAVRTPWWLALLSWQDKACGSTLTVRWLLWRALCLKCDEGQTTSPPWSRDRVPPSWPVSKLQTRIWPWLELLKEESPLPKPGKKAVWQPRLSGSFWQSSQLHPATHRHFQHSVEMAAGSWEQPPAPHLFFFVLLLDVFLTWTHRNLQVSMILRVSLFSSLGQS